MGYFVFENAATYTGATCVRGGVLRTTAYQANETPFGTGSVFLENGMLLTTRAVNHTMASAPGATVTYRGGSILGSLQSNTDQLLTLGPADAAQDAVLMRDGHGVLALIVRDPANTTLGGSWKFKVNGGLSLDANTGHFTEAQVNALSTVVPEPVARRLFTSLTFTVPSATSWSPTTSA